MSKKLAVLAMIGVVLLVGAGCSTQAPTNNDGTDLQENVMGDSTQLSMNELVGDWSGTDGGSSFDRLTLKADGTYEGLSGTYKTTGKWSYQNGIFMIRGNEDNVGDVTFENPTITPDTISGMNKEIDMAIEFKRIK